MNTICLDTLFANPSMYTTHVEGDNFKVKRIVSLRNDFINNTTQDGDVLRWKSNDRCVPLSIFKEAFVKPKQAQVDAANAEDKAAIELYIKNQQNLTAEQKSEQAFEMRAAFGEGKTIVNSITGQQYKT